MTVALYEPLYAPGQLCADPSSLPLVLPDNDRASWRELRILVDIHEQGLHRKADFTGLLSPKFGLKSKMTGAAFSRFVEANAAGDICIVNPFPQLAYFSFNVWMQGEIAHPGLIERTQDLLTACGIDLPIDTQVRHPGGRLCYSNFWAGSEAFWDLYIGGVLVPIARFLRGEPDHPASLGVLQNTAHTDPSPFLPFIVERLLTTFLVRRSDLSVASVPMSAADGCINEFEVEGLAFLEARVDAAETAGSFSPDLVETMQVLCRLRQIYFFERYADKPHPHTGRPMRFVQAGT